MIEQENLDVRTITLGISLMDCIDSDLDRLNDNIYKKITTLASNLVSTGQDIEREFGIPIVNKRISITPIALVWAQHLQDSDDYAEIHKTPDKAAKKRSWCQFYRRIFCAGIKAMTTSEENLIRSVPKDQPVRNVCAVLSPGIYSYRN